MYKLLFIALVNAELEILFQLFLWHTFPTGTKLYLMLIHTPLTDNLD